MLNIRARHSENFATAIFCSTPILALLFIFTAIRTPASDGLLRYKTFLTLFEENTFHSKYSSIQPLLAKLIEIPAQAIFPIFPTDLIPRTFELIVVIIFFAIAVGIVKNARSVALAASLLPLTMITHYFGQFFSEITTSALISIGFLLFIFAKNIPVILIAALITSLGFANQYILTIPLAITTTLAAFQYFSSRSNWRFFLFLIFTLTISTVLILGDLVMKGQLLNNPYSTSAEAGFKTLMPYSGMPGFSTPLFIGLLGSTLSFGKSVFLYNPFLIFLFVRKYPYKIYMLTFFVSALLMYSMWWAWYGGFSFGTRFYMFAIIPSIFVFASNSADETRNFKHIEKIAPLLGVWVAICAKYFGLDDVASVCAANDYALEAFCWYVPEYSPLINPLISHGIIEILSTISYLDYSYFCLTLILFYFMQIYDLKPRNQSA